MIHCKYGCRILSAQKPEKKSPYIHDSPKIHSVKTSSFTPRSPKFSRKRRSGQTFGRAEVMKSLVWRHHFPMKTSANWIPVLVQSASVVPANWHLCAWCDDAKVVPNSSSGYICLHVSLVWQTGWVKLWTRCRRGTMWCFLWMNYFFG